MSDDLILVNPRIDGVIAAWLAEHYNKSKRTANTYADFLVGMCFRSEGRLEHKKYGSATDFRTYVTTHGLDLLLPIGTIDTPQEREHRQAIAYHAQAWAALPHSKTGKEVKASTHNLRLAAISSFYDFAIRRDEYPAPNPIVTVIRRKRKIYTGARPLPFEEGEIAVYLDKIPTDTLNGLRDKALLTMALYTGRRVSEIAALRCGDIERSSIWVVRWEHTKGDKPLVNELDKESPAVISTTQWLKKFYGSRWPADGIVFPSLSRHNYGRQMTPQGLEHRCAKWMPTKKFHQLRHTFSAVFIESGGTIQELSSLLGHSNLAVTTAYVANLGEGKNTKQQEMRDIFAGKKKRKENLEDNAAEQVKIWEGK